MDDPNEALQQARRRIRTLEEELHQAREQLRRCAEERAKETLRINEASLSAFIAQVPAAVAMLDENMCYLSVSQRWVANYYAGRGDIIGECLYDVFPIIEEKWIRLLQRALAGETLRCTEDSFQRTDGTIEWIWWEMLPWRRGDESIGGIIILSEIITEQRRIAAALHESRNMLQLVLDAIPVRVFWKDTSERFMGANMLFAQDAGVASPAELLGKSDYDLSWQQEAALYQQDDRLVIASGQAKLNYEEPQTTPEGTRSWLRTSKIPLRDANQHIIGILGVYEEITERKNAEAALKKSEERYRMLSECTSDWVWEIDEHAIFTDASPRVRDLLGYEPAEVIGKTPFDFMSAGEAERIRRIFLPLAACHEPFFKLENRLKHRDGRLVMMEVRGIAICDETGTFHGYWGIDSDITERKHAEEALKKSEEKYRELTESTSDWVWEVNEHTIYTYVSPRVRDLIGYTPEEIVGKTPFDVMYPEEAERVARIYCPIAERRAAFSLLENTLLRRDGSQVVVETSGVPIFDQAGTFRGYRGIDRDITERKRAQEERESLLAAVQRHAAELDAIISAVADGLIIYGPHLEMVRMNQTAEEMFGYSPEQKALPIEERFKLTQMDTATGTPTSAPVHPIIRALAGETVHGQIVTYVRPVDGRKVWTAISAAPIRSPDGDITGVITTLSDVTKLHDLQQQQEDILHIISHDLRLPLTVIHGHMQLLETLLEERKLDGNMRVSCEAIDRSTQRMNTMIQDLADAARLAGAQLELVITRVDFARYLADLLDRVKMTLEVERIIMDIAPDLPPVAADYDRLERIILNLLSNALKYSPAGSPVTIQARRQDGAIVIAIIDQGRGIAPEEQKYIFDRFYRVKAERKAEGIGLGLYITRILVEAQGGRIWVESQPGKGSVFSFTLPTVQKDSPA